MSLSTRTVNIQLREQNPRARIVSFKPRLTGADGDALLEIKYSTTTNASGAGSINLPVKSSGSIRYDWEVEKEDGLSTGYFHLAAGSAVLFADLIVAGDEASETVLDYVDSQITAHEAEADPHPQYQTQTEADARYSQLGHTHPQSAITNLVSDLALKAPLASPALTGNPTAPTQLTSDNSTRLATTAFVQAIVAALVDSSPEALNTLNELANALGNDENFAVNVMNAIGEIQSALDSRVRMVEVSDETERLSLDDIPFLHVTQSDNGHRYILVGARANTLEDWFDLTEAMSGSSETIYRALLTQSDTDDPTAIVLKNNLGVEVAWLRAGIGSFLGVASGMFPENLTGMNVAPLLQTHTNKLYASSIEWQDADTVHIKTYSFSTPGGTFTRNQSDGLLNNTLVEITVHPSS